MVPGGLELHELAFAAGQDGAEFGLGKKRDRHSAAPGLGASTRKPAHIGQDCSPVHGHHPNSARRIPCLSHGGGPHPLTRQPSHRATSPRLHVLPQARDRPLPSSSHLPTTSGVSESSAAIARARRMHRHRVSGMSRALASAVSRSYRSSSSRYPIPVRDEITNHIAVFDAAFLKDPLGHVEGLSGRWSPTGSD